MTACFFQFLRPHNIILFIETGLQLNQYGNLFAVLCCLCQCRNDGRISADTVKGLLDGQNFRILRCLTHEIYHRVKTHIWMMQEYISLTDHLENVFIILKFRYRSRLITGCFILIKTFCSVNLHQHGQIQRSIDGKNICVFDIKFHLQNIQQTFIHLIFHFQTDHLAPLAFLQLLLDLHQQVLCLILVNSQIRITHDPVRMGAYHIITEKQFINISLYDLLQKDHRGVFCFF